MDVQVQRLQGPLLQLARSTLRLGIFALAPDAFARQLVTLGIVLAIKPLLRSFRYVVASLHWSIVRMWSPRLREIEALQRARSKCKDYEAFRKVNLKLDDVEGFTKWKNDEKSPHFDAHILRARITKYRKAREDGDLEGCMFALRGELLRQHFGACNPALYHVSNIGTKAIIEEYITTVIETITWLAYRHREKPKIGNQLVEMSPAIKLEVAQKLAFFSETKHSFGRSALLLSGGGSIGMRHFGVIKSLHLNGLLPRVICGTSAGSIIGSIACVHTDAELLQMWEKHFDWGKHFDLYFFSGPDLRRFVRERGQSLYDSDTLRKSLRNNIGEYTFLEAFDRTGRICNITLSGAPGNTRYPMLLNYLTAPHVLMWSAVLASCSLPGVFEPQELIAKDRSGNAVPYLTAGLKWLDGSMQGDLPITRLRELFNVNFFIVSQCNPHAQLFSGGSRRSNRGSGGVLDRVAQFLRREVKQYMRSAVEFTKGVSRTSSPWLETVGSVPVALVVQEYEGDVTIFNGNGFLDLPMILTNGSTKNLRAWTVESERSVWWYMSQVQNACAIEFAMDEVIRDLREELVAGGTSSGNALLGMRQSSSQPSLIDRLVPPEHGMGRVPSFYIDQQLSQVGQGKPGARVQQFQGHFQGGKNMRSCKGDGPSNQMGMEMKRASVTCASSQSLVSLLAGACDGLQD